jgi:hypothetical protein
VLNPEAKAKALEIATHGYYWARGGVDVWQFWSAVRKTGVNVAPSEATMLLMLARLWTTCGHAL